jgi:hypothetical protein
VPRKNRLANVPAGTPTPSIHGSENHAPGNGSPSHYFVMNFLEYDGNSGDAPLPASLKSTPFDQTAPSCWHWRAGSGNESFRDFRG